MQSQQPLAEGGLEFLAPYKVDSEIFSLSFAEQVSIQKNFLKFKEWRGRPIPNTYGNKAVIDWNGEPVFAELAVLRLFQSHGWNGVWVDSYRRKFRVGLPDVMAPVELPNEQKKIIDTIRTKTGRSGGCWDVFVWKKDTILFIELKHQKKDSIRITQKQWLEKAIDSGFTTKNFFLVEWI